MSSDQVAALQHELAHVELRPGMEERAQTIRTELAALKAATRSARGTTAQRETTAAPTAPKQ